MAWDVCTGIVLVINHFKGLWFEMYFVIQTFLREELCWFRNAVRMPAQVLRWCWGGWGACSLHFHFASHSRTKEGKQNIRGWEGTITVKFLINLKAVFLLELRPGKKRVRQSGGGAEEMPTSTVLSYGATNIILYSVSIKKKYICCFHFEVCSSGLTGIRQAGLSETAESSASFGYRWPIWCACT